KLDIDRREVVGKESFESVLALMRFVAAAVGLPVLAAPEGGTPRYAFLRVSPDGQAEFLPPASVRGRTTRHSLPGPPGGFVMPVSVGVWAGQLSVFGRRSGGSRMRGRRLRLTRRELLRIGGLGLGGLGLADLLRQEGLGARPNPRARSVILIQHYGGPSHIDLWDPKPDAPAEIRGEFRTIPTSLSAYRVPEVMPRIARPSHHLILI